jgi:hypothetical protein
MQASHKRLLNETTIIITTFSINLLTTAFIIDTVTKIS